MQAATVPAPLDTAALAAVLRAYENNVRSLLDWAHPERLGQMLALGQEAAGALVAQLTALQGARAAAARADCGTALSRCWGLPPPLLDRWRHEPVQRLDALPPALGLGVLRMRALRYRRAEVRRLIDRASRQRLSAWVGVPLDALVGDGDGAVSRRNAGLRPLASLDEATLALEGHALLRRDFSLQHSPCPLLLLALPATVVEAERQMPVQGSDDPDGSRFVFEALPELLPEWSWLFG